MPGTGLVVDWNYCMSQQHTFASFALAQPLLRAIESEGYTQPTPIQAQAIPHLLASRDLIGCAQTGTGKTAAFALPILQRIHTDRKPRRPSLPRVLVLTPTRELADQVSQSFRTYGRHIDCAHAVVFGGVGQTPQVKALRRGVDVVVATPGRLLDLCEQGHVKLSAVEIFVLDEADRMLDMGFLPDMKRIIAKIPAKRQTLLFSATMAPAILQLAEGLLTNPIKVSVTPAVTTADRIDERVLFVQDGKKCAILTKLLDDTTLERALIFTRTKRGADKLVKQLDQAAIAATAIHGNKSQTTRMAALHGFRNGRCRVLVATDIAARGIDVDGITHVVNYDLPNEPASYVHRIGRTARAGATGTAISLCGASEVAFLRDIERLLKRKVPVCKDHPFDTARMRVTTPTGPTGGRRSGGGGRPQNAAPWGARNRSNPNRKRTFGSARGAPRPAYQS